MSKIPSTSADAAMGAAELLVQAGMVSWEAPSAGGALTMGGDPALLRGTPPRTLAALIEQVHEQDRDRLLCVIDSEGAAPRAISYRVTHPERGLIAVHAVVAHRQANGHDVVMLIEAPGVATLVGDPHEARERSAATDAERFMQTCSHDLREPLRMVMGFIGLLSRRSQGMSPAQLEHLAIAMNGAQRLDRMFEGLLRLTRCGRDRADAVVKLDEAVVAAQARLTKQPDSAGAHWRIEPLPAVWGDREQIIELMHELFINAIKFRRGDPAQIAIKAVAGNERMVTVSVSDAGIGIPDSGRERVFDVFQRVGQKEGADGCGIGLALCAKIIAQHRGRIWVESGAPGLTDLRFTLPRSGAPAIKLR